MLVAALNETGVEVTMSVEREVTCFLPIPMDMMSTIG